MERREDQGWTPIPSPPPYAHQIASEFVAEMLNEIMKKITYGNLVYDHYSKEFRTETPLDFRILLVLADFIKTNNEGATTLQLFRDASEWNSIYIQDGIRGFILCIRNCIAYVEAHRNDASALDNLMETLRFEETGLASPRLKAARRRYLETGHGHHHLRQTTRADTWQTYAAKWKLAAKQWEEYLTVCESVYPQDVLGEIFWVFNFMVRKYPKQFWATYWRYAFDYTSYPSVFHAFLNDTVVRQILTDDYDHQIRLCTSVLQDAIDTLQRNEGSYSLERKVLVSRRMREALDATKLTLVPKTISANSRARFQAHSTEFSGPIVYF